MKGPRTYWHSILLHYTGIVHQIHKARGRLRLTLWKLHRQAEGHGTLLTALQVVSSGSRWIVEAVRHRSCWKRRVVWHQYSGLGLSSQSAACCCDHRIMYRHH
jgi:hypothetical protein